MTVFDTFLLAFSIFHDDDEDDDNDTDELTINKIENERWRKARVVKLVHNTEKRLWRWWYIMTYHGGDHGPSGKSFPD